MHLHTGASSQGEQGGGASDRTATVSYAELRRRLGRAYVETWERLRRTAPFLLWIGKPLGLVQFAVEPP